MKQFNFHKQITPLFLLLTLLALITGCASVREQTIVPAYPGTLTYYSSCGRPLYPFDPNYCDPFLGEPFCSSYKSFHDPYWYYYNAYFYPYPPYYPFYPYSPYYGYYYDDDDHHHRRGLRHIINDWADDRKDARDTVTDRGNEWREKSKKRWDEIESAIRERRDARMEQWQGIRESVQDRIRKMGEERRGTFLNNAGNAFSRIGEQRQERIEQRRDFFKGHGLFRNDNHQPLFNRGDTNNGSGSGLFNGGVLRGLGGRR